MNLRLIELAAKLLEAESEDLTMREGRILVVGTDRFVAFAEPLAPEAWRRAAFPSFGLYVFKTDRILACTACPTYQVPAQSGNRSSSCRR